MECAELLDGECITAINSNEGVVVVSIEIAKGANGWIWSGCDGVGECLLVFFSNAW